MLKIKQSSIIRIHVLFPRRLSTQFINTDTILICIKTKAREILNKKKSYDKQKQIKNDWSELNDL